MWKVQLFKLNFDQREVDAVSDVVKSGWLTMGDKTKEFETKFGEMLGNDAKAITVSNGTAALHLALLALGVEPGDEVIIPSLTFVADINTVLLVGATPILADCASLSDWNIDPADIEKKITSKTKAVMIVHYAGNLCDMEKLAVICKKHNLKLIEDCAHAPGASFKGQRAGTFGDINCFSFFTNKNLSVGEGGMITTRSPDLEQQIRYLRSHGMTTLTLDRHKGRAITYDVVRPGLNYRIDEMHAALGLVQLSKLLDSNKQRQQIVERYISAFCEIKGLTIPFVDIGETVPSYHIFPVLLPENCNRLKVIEAMKNDGVQSSIHYPAIQEFTAFKEMNLASTPIANEISRRELTLPLYPTMTEDEVNIVISAFKKAVELGFE